MRCRTKDRGSRASPSPRPSHPSDLDPCRPASPPPKRPAAFRSVPSRQPDGRSSPESAVGPSEPRCSGAKPRCLGAESRSPGGLRVAYWRRVRQSAGTGRRAALPGTSRGRSSGHAPVWSRHRPSTFAAGTIGSGPSRPNVTSTTGRSHGCRAVIVRRSQSVSRRRLVGHVRPERPLDYRKPDGRPLGVQTTYLPFSLSLRAASLSRYACACLRMSRGPSCVIVLIACS